MERDGEMGEKERDNKIGERGRYIIREGERGGREIYNKRGGERDI